MNEWGWCSRTLKCCEWRLLALNMPPSDITPIYPFASSQRPPLPMTVSLWETSVHLPPEPCALADENFAEILRPVAKAASPRKPVKVDVPAAGIPPAASVNVEASIVPPAVAGPSQPLGPSSTATAAGRNTAPPSPLTSIDGDESDSDSGTEKIPRPARASQIPFDSLFGWQNGTLEKVQVSDIWSYRELH